MLIVRLVCCFKVLIRLAFLYKNHCDYLWLFLWNYFLGAELLCQGALHFKCFRNTLLSCPSTRLISLYPLSSINSPVLHCTPSKTKCRVIKSLINWCEILLLNFNFLFLSLLVYLLDTCISFFFPVNYFPFVCFLLHFLQLCFRLFFQCWSSQRRQVVHTNCLHFSTTWSFLSCSPGSITKTIKYKKRN